MVVNVASIKKQEKISALVQFFIKVIFLQNTCYMKIFILLEFQFQALAVRP